MQGGGKLRRCHSNRLQDCVDITLQVTFEDIPATAAKLNRRTLRRCYVDVMTLLRCCYSIVMPLLLLLTVVACKVIRLGLSG